MRRDRMKTFALAVMAVLLGLVTLAACSESRTSEERERQNENYEQLNSDQPAGSMDYSPTRTAVNFWMETWGTDGKLSYVYLLSGDGEYIGYYIFKGLPVSYCAMLTPTYTWDKRTDGSDWELVPAPSMDGVYYAGEGSCDTYYGIDASTGAYVEYTAGMGINVLLYDQPLPLPEGVNPPALGFTEIGEE